MIDKKDLPDGEKEDREIKWQEHRVDVHVERNRRYSVRLDSVQDGKLLLMGMGAYSQAK